MIIIKVEELKKKAERAKMKILLTEYYGREVSESEIDKLWPEYQNAIEKELLWKLMEK